MNRTNLAAVIQAIETKDDLREFIIQLRDCLLENPQDWENDDLPSFLEAMAAWLSDMDDYFRNTAQQSSQIPPYRLFAYILFAASMYE